MFKHKRLAAIVMSLMMVLSLIPAMAFADGTPSITINDGKDIEAAVGETVVEAELANTDTGKKYHVHWTASGNTEKCLLEATNAKKITITTSSKYTDDESTTLTAYLYEGDKCKRDLYDGSTPSCNGESSSPVTSTSVVFRAVKDSVFNSIGLIINGNPIESGTKEKPAITISRWNVTPLTASCENGKKYKFAWQKTDGIEAINFISESGEEQSNDEVTAEGETLKVKGLVEEKVEVKVTAKNQKDEPVGDVSFWIEVKSDMKYGQQGSNVNPKKYDGPQTVEIVKIGDMIVSDEDIDGIKQIKDPGETFTNIITKPINLGEDTNITLFIGKQMNLKNFEQNKSYFIDTALKHIKIFDKDEKRIPGLNDDDIKLIKQNIDRSVTITLPTSKLDAGEYVLFFDKDMMVRENGQPLGANVQFNFTVKNPSIDNPSNDPSKQPVDNQDTDNNGKTDSDVANSNDDSAKTGDDMNIALYAGIMLVALCGGAAVFVRRRKEQ